MAISRLANQGLLLNPNVQAPAPNFVVTPKATAGSGSARGGGGASIATTGASTGGRGGASIATTGASTGGRGGASIATTGASGGRGGAFATKGALDTKTEIAVTKVPPLDVGSFKIPPGDFRPRPTLPIAFKTTTQLARDAAQQLLQAPADVVKEATDLIKAKKVAGKNLMNHLERHTKVGEVLNLYARDWSNETLDDFAAPQAFQMPKSKHDVMDSIVSIAILNDPELEDELWAENISRETGEGLLSSRRIVWQYPPPGTPMTPPYQVLVAVEAQDTMEAEKVIDELVDQLVDVEGYLLPRNAAQRAKLPLKEVRRLPVAVRRPTLSPQAVSLLSQHQPLEASTTNVIASAEAVRSIQNLEAQLRGRG